MACTNQNGSKWFQGEDSISVTSVQTFRFEENLFDLHWWIVYNKINPEPSPGLFNIDKKTRTKNKQDKKKVKNTLIESYLCG